jgi:hypothetical protein
MKATLLLLSLLITLAPCLRADPPSDPNVALPDQVPANQPKPGFRWCERIQQRVTGLRDGLEGTALILQYQLERVTESPPVVILTTAVGVVGYFLGQTCHGIHGF